jgi:HEAT repeat protein
MLLLECVLVFGACQGMEELLRDGESDDLDLRAGSYQSILDRWREWDDDDLALLQGRSRSEDPEAAGRAREVLSRILLLQRIEPTGLRDQENVERIIARGVEEDRLQLLLGNSRRPQELSLLVDLGVEFGWQFSERTSGQLLNFDAGDDVRSLEVGLLSNPSEEVRMNALSKLGAGLAKENDPLLRKLLRDPSASIRRKALAFVPRDSVATLLPELTALLDDGEGGIRSEALDALVVAGFPPTAEEILGRLPDRDPEARASKISALGRWGDPRHAPLIESSLSDPDPRVRSSAVGSLVALLGEAALPSLRPLLDDESGDVRVAVLQALWDEKTGEDIGVALRLLRDPGENVSELAALLLHDRDPEALRALVVSWLGSGDPDLQALARPIAIRYAEILRNADLEQALSDPDISIRYTAFTTLRSRGAGDETWESMLPLLRDPVENLREEVVRYFLLTPFAESLFAPSGAYHSILEDPSSEGWHCRAEIVLRLGLWDEVSSLLPGIEDQCEDAWESVEKALQGAADAGAWDVLESFIYADDGRLARHAFRALERSLDRRGEEELAILAGFPDAPIALRGLDLVREEDPWKRLACLTSLLGATYTPVVRAARNLLAREVALLSEEALLSGATP